MPTFTDVARRTALLAAAAAAAVAIVPAATLAQDATTVPTPTLVEMTDEGLQGRPMWDPWYDVAAFGYEAHEFFVSGTATITGGTDTADYVTRIVVTRPSDPADFSGTVMLDWVNVTAQFENAVNSLTSVEFLLREGWAYVHVSAQAAGICCTPLTPQVWDPVRYADLSHPGDDYANDMFSQIAQAFKNPGDVNPLGDLGAAEVVIAAGQSQGGSRLSNYIATTAADAGVIDAILQQAGGTKTYEVAPALPVIHLLGDREGSLTDPTPHDTYRLWEVAGAAHQDSWVGRQQTEGASTRVTVGVRQSREMAEALWASAGNYGEQPDPREAVCIVNGALFPNRYVANAALHALDTWVRTGEPAPTAPRYEFDGGGLAKDADGNTLGGLRIAPIEHAVATYVADSCNLGGITIPFTEAQLIQRYGDHQTYFDLVAAAIADDVADGFVLEEDAEDFLARACAARPRFGDLSGGPCEVTAAPTPEPDPEPEPDPAPTTDPSPTPAPSEDVDETAEPVAGEDDLPATGGGAAVFGALALTASAAVRRRHA